MHTLPDPLRRDSLAGGLLRALPCAVVLRNPPLEIEIFGGPGYALAMREAFPVERFHAEFTHPTRLEGLHPGYGPESGR